MSSRSAKTSKPPNQQAAAKSASVSATSSLSTHLAMVELKHRILTSLNKLADRDTHQIAVEDLESIIQSLSNDGISMVLNCLHDAVNDPKPAVKKEGVRLLAFLCNAHTDPAASHLTKIIANIVRRLKDADSHVREACRDAIGSLAGLYLKGGNGGDGVVSLFMKPLFEVMSENNKTAQSGGALCWAKMVECAADPPLITFQKLCSRVCKYLNSSNFMAKASMLQVVSSLSQVGAITPQNLEPMLQSIHGCLRSSDWATRKAAADTLSVLSKYAGKITSEVAVSTLNSLEACRFDKVKPVRESMTEAMLLWKKSAGKDGSSDDHKASSHDGDTLESADMSDRNDGDKENKRAVGILKKKAPALTDKELNPEFFQKLEARVSVPVEVILPRRPNNSSISENEDSSESSAAPSQKDRPKGSAGNGSSKEKHEVVEEETIGGQSDCNQREFSNRASCRSEGFVDGKGNWLAIQRQLLLLEKQQAHLMNMLQEFMGGSHDNMLTLESRVRGLERVVEDMAHDLSVSSGWRGGGAVAGFEGSSNRPLSKYNGLPDYSNGKFARGSDGHNHYGERLPAFDGVASGIKSRGSSWRSNPADSLDFHAYGKNGHWCSRRGWGKGAGPVRFSEGPSARSIWQASKDEATLAAIRVASGDSGISRRAQLGAPEMVHDTLGDNGGLQDGDPLWGSWSNAMDALHNGDVESAFTEVVSTGDDFLLVKLMEGCGPVIDQLSSEVASEVVNAISRLVVDPNLFNVCLYWIQQLADIVIDSGPDALGIPMEVRRELLVNLQEACSSVEHPLEGSRPDQLLHQLGSAWEIDVKHFGR
ncbi:microtubule-associated protein TORTIFOLIA1-like isoform X2 [Andrographis paniculata]|uniref:microtubule-associated protein TORTIFOLIA1-like isoform X2 n=1 Tax=Andrographis paniculata TaxID=175694 RepID=UPI0021E981D8|nr:microtubule-associated protein TORTIFOLIA1-like isoform X2 [Andrographis paniculata]